MYFHHQSWGLGVGGSTPLAPTNKIKDLGQMVSYPTMHWVNGPCLRWRRDRPLVASLINLFETVLLFDVCLERGRPSVGSKDLFAYPSSIFGNNMHWNWAPLFGRASAEGSRGKLHRNLSLRGKG